MYSCELCHLLLYYLITFIMKSDWTDEEAVLRDLAIVQGVVPGKISNIVFGNSKPPKLQLVEETEEAYFPLYVDDKNIPASPDLKQIQEYLNKVRNVSVNEIDNPQPFEKIDYDTIESKPDEFTSTKKKKKQRNVAIASLLRLKQNSENDLQTGSQNNIQTPFGIMSSSMFKSKSNRNGHFNNASTSSQTNDIVSELSKPRVYVPSHQAQEYYNNFMEHKRKKEVLKREETIWTKAESKMMEIEKKRNGMVNTENNEV